MKKRVTVALAAAMLVVAMAPGIASADPPATKMTQICHFGGHETEVLTSVGLETLTDFYFGTPGSMLTPFFEEACGWFGGRVIRVNNNALDGHRAEAKESLPTD